VIFQDFSGPGIFEKKIQDFQEAWEPGNLSLVRLDGWDNKWVDW